MALQPAQLDMIDIEKKTRAEKKNNIRQPTKGLGQQLRGFGGGEKIQRRWISVPAGVQPTALLWLAGRCIPGRSWLFGSISPNQRREQAKKGFAATLDFAAFVSAFSRTRRGSTLIRRDETRPCLYIDSSDRRFASSIFCPNLNEHDMRISEDRQRHNRQRQNLGHNEAEAVRNWVFVVYSPRGRAENDIRPFLPGGL